jgi:hypothetical protein
MLTPAAAEGQMSLWSGSAGILGWDKLAFYNPSFLMLTLHRTAANFAYAGFVVAGICGYWLYKSKTSPGRDWHEWGGRLSFNVAYMSFLTLPVIGFFYAWVLKYHAREAYDNLMIGRGDIVAGGVDWWWVKQLIVASMIGLGLVYNRKTSKSGVAFTLPAFAVYLLSFLYLMFYLGMAIQMTWRFFWGMLAAAILAGMWGRHLLNRYEGSGRAVFVLMAVLSFLTVCLGGYVREASRPRFVTPEGNRVAGFNRIHPYSSAYTEAERAEDLSIRMVKERPDYVKDLPGRQVEVDTDAFSGADLVSTRCISCHTLERIHRYPDADWDRVVGRMRAYGTRLTEEENRKIIDYLVEKYNPEAANTLE